MSTSKTKTKLCKICNKKTRYCNTSWCFSCYRQREKEKKLIKELQKKERKESTKKFQESLRKTLYRKAWTLQSEWIRRKNANLDGHVICYTCDKPTEYKKASAGHFKHDRLDFDDRNLKPQCYSCNVSYSGKLDVYAERLIEDHGLDWFNKLVHDANQPHKYEPEELKQIIEDLQRKLRNLDLLTPNHV